MYVIRISYVTQEDETLKICLLFDLWCQNKPFGFSSQPEALSQNKGFLHQNFIVHNKYAQF